MSENERELQTVVERLQVQVKTMEKLSSLGMLSAGIAHEIQNPLNFVINFTKLSCRLLEDLEEIVEGQTRDEADRDEITEIIAGLKENLQKTLEHGERAISIIRGILLYSRGKEDEFVETDLKHLVKEYVWLAYHAMRANHKDFNITIREEYEDDLPMQKVIPQDFSRVVLNLMNNACYAVRDRALREEKEYSPEIRIQLQCHGKGFLFRIEDNGIGMLPEVKEKLFTAFFTTKPIGEGTGLGLSIVRSIIEEKHKGKIGFETKEGKGTSFWVTVG